MAICGSQPSGNRATRKSLAESSLETRFYENRPDRNKVSIAAHERRLKELRSDSSEYEVPAKCQRSDEYDLPCSSTYVRPTPKAAVLNPVQGEHVALSQVRACGSQPSVVPPSDFRKPS